MNYYFTEKISNKKVAVPAKEVVFPVQFERDENKDFVGFKFNDDVEEANKRKLVLQIGKALECRIKKNTPRSKKEKVVEEPVSKEQEPELPGPPVKKERKSKKVKEEVKEEVKPEERNLSNKPPRKQRPRKEKKTD